MLISRTNSFQKMLMQQIPSSCWDYPETFAVDDEGTWLILILLAEPHLLKGGQGSQDGAPDPLRALVLRAGQGMGSDDQDLCWAACQGSDLLLHISEMPAYMVVSADSAGLDYKVFVDVHIILYDEFEGELMDVTRFHNQGWKSSSGHWHHLLPVVITCLSGSSYLFSKEEEDSALTNSCLKSRVTKGSFSLMSYTISYSKVVMNL